MFYSVIVPVYKTEKYLKSCVDSVLKQTFSDYELILIDDGSPDTCPKICDEYAQRYSHVRVIHKKNGGLSDARNCGIKAAHGKYLIFMDSDDFWDNRYVLENLKKEVEKQNCDTLNYHFKYYYDDTKKSKEYFSEINEEYLFDLNDDEKFLYLVQKDQFIASACNKVISNSLIKDNDLYFRTGIVSEDIDWCARLAVYSKKMGGCNVNGYCYRQRTQSITHSITEKNVEMIRQNIEECLKYLNRLEKNSRKRKAYLSFVSYQYGTLIYNCNVLKGNDRRIQIEKAKTLRKLLYYSSNRKVKVLSFLDRFFGFRVMNLIVKMFITIFRNEGK